MKFRLYTNEKSRAKDAKLANEFSALQPSRDISLITIRA